MKISKTLVIGLDGASFELIRTWIKEGTLPNIGEITKEGIFGDLESQLPPVTAPNWKCYSTGKNPGKLGIFWWENINWGKKRISCPNYRTNQKEIWDYLNNENIRSAVINTPLTYPPKKINGYLVAGGPDAENEDYFYPNSLSKILKEIDYKVHTDKSISSKEDCKKYFEEINGLIETRFELAKKLLQKDEDLNFMHLTIFYINVLQHFLWDDELTKKAWKTIDKNIGKLLEICQNKEFNILLMSDHGSNEIKDNFNINTWLEEKKYLKTSKSIPDILDKIGLNRKKAIKLAENLGIKNLLIKILPSTITSSLPSEEGGVSREAKGHLIDWKKSKTIASGQGPLYIKKENKDDKKYENFKNKLKKELENLESPISKRKIIRKVFKKEEIYSGKYLKQAPDLVIDQAPHTHITGDIGKNKIFEKPSKWKGENKKTGLFAAIGPDIKKGKNKNISILDLAPTILHTYGIPIPKTMDGKVLIEIFKEESEPSKRKIKYEKPSEKENIKSRISELKKSDKI